MPSVNAMFHFDEIVEQMLKDASQKAREKDFNSAIEIMLETLDKISINDVSYSFQTYTKILPYFQKAGRYKDAIEYADKTLIPYFVNNYDDVGSTDKAFICLYVGKIHEKLALNAKREKVEKDRVFFTEKSKEMDKAYLKLLEIGKIEDLKEDYQESISLFGENPNVWPDVLRNKFKSLLDN